MLSTGNQELVIYSLSLVVSFPSSSYSKVSAVRIFVNKNLPRFLGRDIKNLPGRGAREDSSSIKRTSRTQQKGRKVDDFGRLTPKKRSGKPLFRQAVTAALAAGGRRGDATENTLERSK